jgi:hypothetical protein
MGKFLFLFFETLSNVSRRSAFVLIVLSKVLFLGHVFQLVQSNLAHSKMVLEALLHQVCVFHNSSHAQCPRLADL